ncbi:MAG: hypothetical protein ACP5KN_01010 [Armatimonadota bacterium]
MSTESREQREIVRGGRLQRRDFLRRLLVAAVGLPAAGAVLGGCGGGGLLDDGQGADGDGDDGGQPDGDLEAEVEDTRRTLITVINAATGGQEELDVQPLLGQLNAQLAVVWPLMVAAPAADLRANVPTALQPVLERLDGLEDVTVGFAGQAPEITTQRLEEAWARADELSAINAGTESSPADEAQWVLLLVLMLLLPSLSDEAAATYASAGVDEALADDDRNLARAAELYEMLHPEDPVACTSCLLGHIMGLALSLGLYVYLGMGAHAAGEPGLLFGFDWVAALVLLAAHVNVAEL